MYATRAAPLHVRVTRQHHKSTNYFFALPSMSTSACAAGCQVPAGLRIHRHLRCRLQARAGLPAPHGEEPCVGAKQHVVKHSVLWFGTCSAQSVVSTCRFCTAVSVARLLQTSRHSLPSQVLLAAASRGGAMTSISWPCRIAGAVPGRQCRHRLCAGTLGVHQPRGVVPHEGACPTLITDIVTLAMYVFWLCPTVCQQHEHT